MNGDEPLWLTIREAAYSLGVSELTIRRRIKDGRVAHRLVNGKYLVDTSSMSVVSDRSTVSDELPSHEATATIPDLDAKLGDALASPAEPTSVAATGAGAVGDTRSMQPTHPPAAAPLNLDALLHEHARLAETAGRAQLLDEQLRDLSRRHEELTESMVTLASRNGWLQGKLEERESEVKLLMDERPRPSWWRRLFGG